MFYRSKDAAALYNVTPQTVGAWAKEFAEYLSDKANPGRKKQRLFTKEDMMVFSLVSDMQDKGLTFTDMHATLITGNRGEPPTIEPTEVQVIVASEHENRLAIDNERLTRMLVDAQKALKKAEEDLGRLRETEDKNLKLETQLEGALSAKDELQSQVAKLQEKIEQLAEKAGQEFARGYVAGFQEKSRAPDNNKENSQG